nr:MAG TPA: receptor binding complex [Myoviridae sp. ct5lt7]
MARYPGTLESANTDEFGIVFADHIQGHRTVANLEALYKLSDAILSKSKNNTGNDAIGQEWYVISEKSVYRLDDWANRKQASGWRKLQNVDTEFDSLQSHGADKIKNFTTTANDVTLNYNTWKNSETSEDGIAVIPAATGDNAGVLTANGKDQLDQLNKIGSVSHMKDAGIFTKSASKLTFNYNCISTTAGATSAIETKYEDIPAATGDLAGVLTADGKDQLDQLNKIGEVTHLKDGGVITTDATKATIHYTCIDTTAGATSSTVEKTADIPAASLTNAGMLAADQRNQLEQLNKLGAISKINDSDDETTPTFTTTEDTVTLNYKNISSTAGANSSVVTKTADIPVVTQSKAGILTAADKTKLDGLNTNNISGISVTSNESKATFTVKKDNGNSADSTSTFDFPVSSTTKAGTVTAKDKIALTNLEAMTAITHVKDDTAFTRSASDVKLNFSCVNPNSSDDSLGTVTEHSVSIGAATSSLAGVMTSTDKTELDRITTANFALGAVTPNASTVAIAATKTTISTGASANNNITLPSATSSLAGVMTAADKVKLDTTLPNQISAETSRATTREKELDNKIDTTKSDILGTATESGNTLGELEDRLEAEVSRATTKENQLQSSINSNKGTIDNYTVNGIKISTNPVITGANAKVTGYSKPTSTSAIAATDSINAALGKLEKKADDHIANKSNPHGVTKAQVGLGNCDNTSDLNKPISTATQTALNSKVQTVEVTGTGNAITAASISGTKLTLTKGATYNNQTYTAGTNLSLSGNTFSLNSTISLTRVNASSGFFQTSDKRLKSNIKPLDHSLEDICSIPTDSFILNGKNDFGTIAQEVEDKFPELVSEARLKESDVDEPSKFDKVEINGESYVLVKEVDYSKLSILAIEGIKLLKKEIEELKKQLNK